MPTLNNADREHLKDKGLILATRNPGKIAEFRRVLEPLGVVVRFAVEAGARDEPEETADTFEGNAAIKALDIYRQVRLPVLADDSGLEVDALDGRPGVYSARYGGQGLSDKDRRELLLKEMRDIAPADRTARFVCVLALTLDGTNTQYFRGTCEGRILAEARGEGGFGYDPVFGDPESGASFAELTPEQKDARSHRGHAIRELLSALQA